MIRSATVALCVSILIHGFIAVGLIAYLEYAPQPDVLATLDLSSVELSFAEKEEDARPVLGAGASSPAQNEIKPPQEEKPPEAKPEKPLPPDPAAYRFPEPKEAVEKMVTPKDKRTSEQSEQSNISPTAAPRQARLDAPPRPKRSIRPDYPKGARQRGEQGDVVLEIRVNAEGTVDDVKVAVSSGFAELDEAAVRAARGARFSPARSGRDPVASTARLKLQFKLK